MTTGAPSSSDRRVEEAPLPRGGIDALAGVLAFLFAVLAVRAITMQLTGASEALRRVVRDASPRRPVRATRGRLLDAHGVVVAQDVAALRIDVDSRAREYSPEILAVLDRALRWTPARRHDAAILLASLDARDLRVHTLESAARTDDPSRLERALRAIPGVHVSATTTRGYPFGAEMFHVVGVSRGPSGVERVLDATLRGTPGWERPAPRGNDGTADTESWRLLLAAAREPRGSAPTDGRTVRLTLDSALQHDIALAFDQTGFATGAAVVLEASTGRVVAAYSRPALDPAAFTATLSPTDWSLSRDASSSPLLDQYAARAHRPGFTFVPFSAMSAIVDSDGAESRTIDCAGTMGFGDRQWHDTGFHGRGVDLVRALATHCYLYCFQMATITSLDHQAAIARSFGLGAPTGFVASPESRGSVPDRSDFVRRMGHFSLGSTLNAMIGYVQSVTPMQLAVAYAALVNGGDVFEPQLIDAIEATGGELVARPRAAPRRHVEVPHGAREHVLDALREASSSLPEDLAGLDAHPSPGADPRDDLCNNWFAGFFPRAAPRYVVVVFVATVPDLGNPARAVALAASRHLRIAAGDTP
ncbi:MAG: penicillin-binding transpeptidase domain-containing protein [Deltaproteobacteria bacterium]